MPELARAQLAQRHVEDDMQRPDRTQPALFQQDAARGPISRVKDEVLVDAQYPGFFGRERGQPLAIRDGRRHGLFEKHIQPGIEQLPRHRCVRVRRRQHMRHVGDPGLDQRVDVGEAARNSELRGAGLRQRQIAIHDRGDLGIGHRGLEALDMRGGDKAGADQGGAEAGHRIPWNILRKPRCTRAAAGQQCFISARPMAPRIP